MIDGIDFLQLLWFLLIGLLFMIFYFTEGFDYGVGMATKFLARNDQEKHLMMETIGPHWDGNEVWLITAGVPCLLHFLIGMQVYLVDIIFCSSLPYLP